MLGYSTNYHAVLLAKIERCRHRARRKISMGYGGLPDMVVTGILVCVPLLLIMTSVFAMSWAWSGHQGQVQSSQTSDGPPSFGGR